MFKSFTNWFYGRETEHQKEIRKTIRQILETADLGDLNKLAKLCGDYPECMILPQYDDRYHPMRWQMISPFYRAMCDPRIPTEFALVMWGHGADVRHTTGEGEHIQGAVYSADFLPILIDGLQKGASPNHLCETGEYLLFDAVRHYNHRAIKILVEHPDFEMPERVISHPSTWSKIFKSWYCGSYEDYRNRQKVKKYRPDLLDPKSMEETLNILISLGLEVKHHPEPWCPHDAKHQRKILLKFDYPAANFNKDND